LTVSFPASLARAASRADLDIPARLASPMELAAVTTDTDMEETTVAMMNTDMKATTPTLPVASQASLVEATAQASLESLADRDLTQSPTRAPQAATMDMETVTESPMEVMMDTAMVDMTPAIQAANQESLAETTAQESLESLADMDLNPSLARVPQAVMMDMEATMDTTVGTLLVPIPHTLASQESLAETTAQASQESLADMDLTPSLTRVPQAVTMDTDMEATTDTMAGTLLVPIPHTLASQESLADMDLTPSPARVPQAVTMDTDMEATTDTMAGTLLVPTPRTLASQESLAAKDQAPENLASLADQDLTLQNPVMTDNITATAMEVTEEERKRLLLVKTCVLVLIARDRKAHVGAFSV